MVTSAIRDISERKLVDESQFRLAAIVESSDDAIISKNLAAIVTSWNAAAQHIFGYTGQEAIGRPIANLVPPELREEENKILERLKAGGRIDHYETVRVTKAGNKINVSLSISPIKDSTGRIIGFCKIARDITERKRAEEALASFSGRLIGAQDEERKRIAREIHDDYSQRLAMLALGLEQLAEDVGDSSADASQKVHELLHRVGELAEDLHALSHRLHSSTLESLGLVAGLKAFCVEFSDQQGIQVDFASENVPHGIPGDATLCIFRIAQEALRNVKKHSGANRAVVRLEWAGDGLHLSVSDLGRGFDSNKPSAEHGIGIRSMEERLRLLGGQLEVQSLLMEGTRIEAWLPFKIASQRGG